jgi:transcription initiation factor TFIIE subunit alpha
MKLTKKEIDNIISQVAGEDVLPLVKALKNRKNVSEFKLAEKIKKEINRTRNMLYRLYDYNLVSFIRKKDKKKGWYIYYWTFNEKKIKDVIKNIKKKKLDILTERLTRENSSQFYACKHRCVRLDFEQSTDFEFKCPECGELLNLEDNTKKKKEIEKEIKQLKRELKK